MSVRTGKGNRVAWWLKDLFQPRRTPRGNRLTLETLEDRTVPAPIPTTSITPPTAALIGQQTTLGVTFDNTSTIATDIGYAPYVDLYLPSTGKDGNDGIRFASATYLGLPVNATVIQLTAAGVNHPYARNASGQPIKILPPAGFKAGDQLVVLELPFGSFTPAQPVVNLSVAVNVSKLADLNAPLPIRAQGGFRFGADPLNNPTTDPTIIGPASTQTVTPQLFTLRKVYIGPENETATGPNYVRQYQVIVDIADGQTVKSLRLTDILPSNLQFVKVDSVTGNGTILVVPLSTPSTTVPGGTLTRTLDSVTGTAGDSDAVMTFSFYAPLMTSVPSQVLNLATGLPSTAVDDAKATGTWTPIDTRDPVVTTASDVTPNDHTLTLRSIATQKTVALVNDTGAPGYTPGDTLEYTLQGQISDYFAFDNIVLTDLLSDGLLLDPGFTPTLLVSEHGVTTSTPFTGTNFTNTPGTPNDTLTFNVSGQLMALGQDGILLGGNIPPGGTGAGNLPQSAPPLFTPGTTFTIKFRALIADTYEQVQPSGTDTVTPNDRITNNVSVSGSVLNYRNLLPQPLVPPVTDNSSAGITIVDQTATKTVYAVNGNTAIGTDITITPGDTVTYRLRVTLPTTSANNFKLTDFLPAPLFNAAELTTLNLTTPSATPPPAGTATLGPDDTFYAVYTSPSVGGTGPAVIVDPASNSATLDFGSFNDLDNVSTTLDILFTVTATNAPKADLLQLTNQFLSQDNNNQNTTSTDTTIIQVITSEPNLPEGSIQKGVVATNNPNAVFTPVVTGPVPFSAPGSAGTRFTGTITTSNALATPINSNLSGVDAGDLVTFAVVVGNVGSGPNGAFDVRIRDTLPAGFVIPTTGLNLRVTDGTGAVMGFINLGTGATSGLFGTGIELTDPGPTPSPGGALDPGKDTLGNFINNGRNLVVITYDLRVAGTITPNATMTNTASVFSFADSEGGPNFLPIPRSDTATVTTTVPTITKRLVGTEIVNANNNSTQAVIGELVTYQLTITVPEGQTLGMQIQDTLDDGLAFVRLNSITKSAGIVAAVGTPAITNNGRTATYTIGTVTNTNRDNNVAETITLTYTAIVLNQASNQNGTQLKNAARVTFTGGNTPTASSAPITVIEPTINVSKQAVVNGVGTVGQANQPVDYTIVVSNPGTVDAFDVALSDPLPRAVSGQTLISNPVLASVVDSAGLVTSAAFQIVGTAATGFTLRTIPGVTFDFPVNAGRTITIRVTGTLATTVQPGQLIRNTATVTWTSLNGNPGTRSPFNAASTERTGSGVAPNDYRDTGSADITIGGSIVKSLVSTSSSSTEGNNVAVGEIVRYQLIGTFPQGTAPNLEFLDRLPAGLQYINDGKTTVAFVSNGAGFSVDNSIFPVGSSAFVPGNQFTSVVPTFVLPSSQITVAPGSGGDVTFAFGTVVNNDIDIDQELIILQFNALVLNEAGNQAGVVLNNDYLVRQDGVVTGNPSAPVAVKVVEPTVTTKKEVSPTTGDAGDRVDFVVTVTNATGTNVSAAHDVRILDQLPPQYILDNSSITVTPIGTNTTVTNNSSGNTLDVTLATLLPGASAVIRYSAVLSQSVTPLQVIPNTATTTYTSLSGLNGELLNPTGTITPGVSGATDGERNGVGGVNDYISSGSASVQVPALALNKVVATTSFTQTGLAQYDPTLTDLAIGETVTFLVAVRVPEVTTPAILVDTLPISPGVLEALGSRIVSIGANISGSLLNVGDAGVLADRNNDGMNDQVTFNFGTLVNAPNNVTNTGDFIVVEITARVANVPANVKGLKLTNTATLSYLNGQATDTASVEIVEPELEITKNIVSTNTVSAGGVVDYEAHVTHTTASTMDAVNVTIDDLLPPGNGLTLVSGSVVVTSGTGAAVTGVVVTELGTGGFDVTLPSIPLGEEVIIRYQATVSQMASPGDTLPNTIEVDYNGTPDNATTRPQEDDATAKLVVDGASLSGHVFQDQQPGPGLPIPGTRVTLIGVDVGNAPVLRTTTTDATGFYIFGNLTPGSYTIIESQPTGYISSRQSPGSPYGQTSPIENRLNASIDPGSTAAAINFDFYEVRPSSLSGTVYVDLFQDGDRDSGDPGIPGVTVTLSGNDWNGNPVSLTTTTNLLGAYEFTNLLPGDYMITETQPPILVDGDETVGTAGGALAAPDTINTIALNQGTDGTDYNFGEFIPNALSGIVYLDRNQDSIYQSAIDRPLPGILLTLRDPLNNVVATTTTGADGRYSFANQAPGTYTITESQPVGFGSSEIPLDVRTAMMPIGGTVTNQNFGDTLGNISGIVYRDYNLNGVFDTTARVPDRGIAGITVQLRNALGTVVRTTTTDANGRYIFQDLPLGIYTVIETQPPRPTTLFNGFYDGADNLGTLGGTRPRKNAMRLLLGLDATTQVSQNGLNYNFGELPPADPLGFVYNDLNRNGIKDPGEPGIAGVAITISGTAFAGTPFARPLTGADLPGGSLTVFTNANGFYQFVPIPPGLYTIRETQPAGYLDGLEQNGDPFAPPPIVGNDVFINIFLDPLPIRGPFNFGEFGQSSKRGLLGSNM